MKNEEQFLENYRVTDFERPSITVDNLLFAIDEIENNDIRKLNEKRLQILLIKRENHPYKGMWCLPGTFVKMNETLEEASIRCLKVKTNIKDVYLEQLYTFGDIKRDPRTRVLSVSYMGLANKKNINIKDSNTSWFTVKVFEKKDDSYEIIFDNEKGIIIKTIVSNDTILENNNIGFDHIKIILYGLLRMKNKLEYTDIAFSMLDNRFTLAELQQVYEIILNKKLTKANFQRKIKDKVECLNIYKTGGFRPALLYKYKNK